VYWTFKILFTVINLIIQGHFITIEKKQSKGLKLLDYLEFWNLINILQIALNLVTVVCSFFMEENTDDLYTLAAISMFISCLNLFYIIRIYDNLAWFIVLLSKTVKDLDSIIIVFFICLITFGNTSLILQKSRSSESEPLIPDVVGLQLIDAWVT